MKRFIIGIFSLTLGLVFILSNVHPINAQDAGEYEFTLEEITVTAQKREENQQKVAIAMETITSDEMKVLGKDNIDEILSSITNVIINTSTDGMRITMRGLVDDASLYNNMHVSQPTVAVNMDGAYNSNSNAAQNLYDVERVEVLFGPQSTMYASNSPGGIVNIVTASPKINKYSASGTLEYGSYNLKRVQGSLNVPLGSKFAARAAVNWTKRGSYVSGDTDNHSKSGRLKALYQANDDLSITLTGTYTVTGNGGNMGGQIEPFWKQDGYYADGTKITDPWKATESTESNPGEGETGNMSDQTTKGMNATIDWDSSVGSLSINPSWSKGDSDQYGTMEDNDTGASYSTHMIQTNKQQGVEVRMTSSSDFTLFKWIAGANYYKYLDERLTYQSNQAEASYYKNNEKARALFANITYPFTSTLRGTVGYRQSWDQRWYDEYDPETSSNEAPDAGQPAGEVTDQDYSNHDTKIGFEYDVADNFMVYGDRSTTYRMQNMGMSSTTGEENPPEKLVAYTLGGKSRFLNNKLQVNASAFYYDYKNKMANQAKRGTFTAAEITHNGVRVEQYDQGELITDLDTEVTINDADSQTTGDFRSIGLDIQTSWIVTNYDKVTVSASYLNTEWKRLKFDYYYDNFEDEDFSGKENTYSPTWTINASYEHSFLLPNGGTLTGSIDCQFQTSYLLSWRQAYESGNPEYRYDYQEASYIFNSSFIYAAPSGKWTLAPYVKNITNYAKKVSLFTMDNDDGSTRVESMMLNDPRTYGAVLSVNF